MTNELTVRGAPAQDMALLLERVIANDTITPDKLDAMLRMRRELVDEERREQYQDAFAELQAELPAVPKTGIVKLGNGKTYNFGKYHEMMAALQPILSRHNFSVRFTVLPQPDGRIVVRCFLMRNGCETYGDAPPLPPDIGPGRNDAQAAGSSNTYGKRYALTNVLNLVWCDVDDDAVSVPDMTITPAQINELQDLLDHTGADCGKFLKFCQVQKLPDILARDFAARKTAIAKWYEETCRKTLPATATSSGGAPRASHTKSSPRTPAYRSSGLARS